MNIRSLGCLLAIGAAVPTVALAQGETSVGVFGSYWDTDEADEAWGLGAKGRLGMFELRATWFDDVKSVRAGGTVEIDAFPLEAGIVYNFMPTLPLNPYVGAGVSYHVLDTNVGDIDNEWGWYAVVGGEWGLTDGISLLGELMYRDVDGTVTNLPGDIFTQERADIDLSGVGVNLGVAWRF